MKAFPSPIYEHPKIERWCFNEGMDLRDYFAANVLPNIIAANPVTGRFPKETEFQICAEYSYQLADAMMEARKK